MPFEAGRPGGAWPRGTEHWEDRGERREDPSGSRRSWTPQSHVFERDGAAVIQVELPGIDRKDVVVEIEDEMLVVEGERTDDRPPDNEAARSTYGYGRFCKQIALPHPVDASDLKAQFRNGVLEIEVPGVSREERRRSIKIET